MTHRESAFPLVRLRTAIASLILSGETDASQAYSVVHSAFIGLLVALAYYAGSQVGFLLTPEGSPIAVFWPPNAILLAALLLTPRRIWWLLILAVLPAHLLTQLRLGIPLTATLGWFFGNTGEALLGAVCIRIFQKSKPLFECVHGVIVFLIFGVFLPTLTTSFFDAAGVIVSGLGQDYWSLWLTRLTSNIVADLTVVPTIVILGLKGLSWFRRANTLAYCEAAALAAGTVMVSLLVFGMDSAGSGVWALIYALLPLLIWTVAIWNWRSHCVVAGRHIDFRLDYCAWKRAARSAVVGLRGFVPSFYADCPGGVIPVVGSAARGEAQ